MKGWQDERISNKHLIPRARANGRKIWSFAYSILWALLVCKYISDGKSRSHCFSSLSELPCFEDTESWGEPIKMEVGPSEWANGQVVDSGRHEFLHSAVSQKVSSPLPNKDSGSPTLSPSTEPSLWPQSFHWSCRAGNWIWFQVNLSSLRSYTFTIKNLSSLISRVCNCCSVAFACQRCEPFTCADDTVSQELMGRPGPPSFVGCDCCQV